MATEIAPRHRGDLMVGRPAGRAPAAGPAARAARSTQVEELCRRARRVSYEAEDRGFVLVRGGRRLPLPEPPRPRALRRALRARGPVGPPVGGRARDAGDRRLQAADLPGPGGGHPRRQRRRRDAHAASSGATSPRSARDPGPGQAVLFGTTPTFLERLGLDSLDDLPPLGDFVPGADVVEALEQGLRLPTSDDPDGAGPDAGCRPADLDDRSMPTTRPRPRPRRPIRRCARDEPDG